MDKLVGIGNLVIRPALLSKNSVVRSNGFWSNVRRATSALLAEHAANLPPNVQALHLDASGVNLDTVTAENQDEAVQYLGGLLANKIIGLIPTWHRRYLADAKEFERRLGIFIIDGSKGNFRKGYDAVTSACGYALAYMEKLSQSKGVVDDLDALLKKCGAGGAHDSGEMFNPKKGKIVPIKYEHWGGSVGLNIDRIRAVFERGNVREKVMHLDYFIEHVLGNDLLNQASTAVARYLEAAKQAGFDMEALKARREALIKARPDDYISGRLVGSAPHSPELSTGSKGVGDVDIHPLDVTKVGYKDMESTFKVQKLNGQLVELKDENGKPFRGMDVVVFDWASAIMEDPRLTPDDRLSLFRNRAAEMGVDPGAHDPSIPIQDQIAKLKKIICSIGSTATMGEEFEVRDKDGNLIATAAMSERELAGHFVVDEETGQVFESDGKTLVTTDTILPWNLGSKVNVVNESHEWIRQARAAAMPIESAISGTTNRVMNLGEMIKDFDQDKMRGLRLACLGYLINIHAHTFHEIMGGSAGHSGCEYKPGRDAYRRIDPLTEEDLLQMGVGFPDDRGMTGKE